MKPPLPDGQDYAFEPEHERGQDSEPLGRLLGADHAVGVDTIKGALKDEPADRAMAFLLSPLAEW